MPLESRIHILLVDDDEVDREAFRRGLSRAKLSVSLTEADTAETALALIGDPSNTFDCAVFDLHLPGRDGRELLSDLRALGHELPVIFLTGQGNEDAAVELMKAGACDYLPKASLAPARLAQSIGHALRLAQARDLQREAEAALRESEASFRRLADHLPDTVVRFDSDHRHAYCNRAPPWAPEADLVCMTNATFADASRLDPAATSRIERAIDQALRGQSTTLTFEVHAHQTDPYDEDEDDENDDVVEVSSRHFELRLAPESAPGQRLQANDVSHPTVLAIVRDITADVFRKADEQRRADFERQLIGIVSHDLRNPISAIGMTSDTLRRLLGSDPRAERILALLDASTTRASRLVNDILDFTKARLGGGIPMKRRQANLGDVARAIVAETRSAHPGHTIDLHQSGDLSGRFDADRIAQVLANLLSNAIAHGSDGQPVTVALEGRNNAVALSVSNHGPTLSADTIRSIFEPYRQGDPGASRTSGNHSVGLGLFIVGHIVDAHRGQIAVDSNDGRTTFAVTLPRRSVTTTIRAITLTDIEAVRVE
jgi:signal transduction histidine kinase